MDIKRQQQVAGFVGGNQQALAFVVGMIARFERWDAASQPADDDVWIELSVLTNPFFRQHFDALSPVVNVAVMEWAAARAVLADSTAPAGLQEAARFRRVAWVPIAIMASGLCLGERAALMVKEIWRFAYPEKA